MRAAAAVAGLLGGLCWVGALRMDLLAVLGAALLAIAVLGAGAALVSRSAVGLRVLVAFCFLALVASVLQVLRDNVDPDVVLAAAGVVAVVVAGLALARRPPREQRVGGSHAA
ncbi:hypothetical protein [Nocardioides pyridinolyticus]